MIIGAVALIAFGPDQLPKVARKAGQVLREVQNTSQGFIREMERAAETDDAPTMPVYGRVAEPTPAPEPFPMHDPFASANGVAPPAEPVDRPRRRFSASEWP